MRWRREGGREGESRRASGQSAHAAQVGERRKEREGGREGRKEGRRKSGPSCDDDDDDDDDDLNASSK